MLQQKELPKKLWVEAWLFSWKIDFLHEIFKIKILSRLDTIDRPPIHGTRLLSDIYQRNKIALCNISV
ncbi:hypothetical protein CR513_24580, partial [Mucuna pruriens]